MLWGGEMIIHKMKSELPNGKAEQFYDFMIEPNDEAYSGWLPEHHQYHIVKRGKNSPVGDVVFFDQHISPKHRLKSYAKVVVANRPNEIVVQCKKMKLNVPVYVRLKFTDTENGLLLEEELRAGYKGIGKIFDPLFAIFIGRKFREALTLHHEKEWKELEKILQGNEK